MPTLYPRPSKWLVWLPVWSFGVLAFVSAVGVAVEANSRKTWMWAAGFIVLDGVAMLAASGADEGADGSPQGFGGGVAVAFALAAMVAGPFFTLTTAKAVARRRLAQEAELRSPSTRTRNQAALAAAEDARRRRAEAAVLTQTDPQIARELGIGRPDLHSRYDDGGLIDINSAPLSVFVEHLHLSQDDAGEILDARAQLGRFAQVSDLLTLVHLDPAVFDRIRDRLILL